MVRGRTSAVHPVGEAGVLLAAVDPRHARADADESGVHRLNQILRQLRVHARRRHVKVHLPK